MYKKIRRTIARNILNVYGWRTKRKIVVIESDDWGSIRMPSKDVYNKLLKKGIPVDKSPYCKYDSLASVSDLNRLFNVLVNFKDYKNNHPVITANTVVANPDFDKIKASGFNEYYYELITDTFKKYPKHSECFFLWEKGYKTGVFHPQSHGREHLNVQLWLKLLKNQHPDFLYTFENKCWGLSDNIYSQMKMSIQAAFDLQSYDEIPFQKKTICDGLELFEEIFGFKSRSFIANNFIWDPILNETLFESGVNYLQGMKYQKKPLLGKKKREMIRHYLGEKNQFNQYYLIRNCKFEPSQKNSNFDDVNECMKDISNAFFWNKPAIISSHRLNYVGFLDTQNRDRNLRLLEELLTKIVKKWPEVEFITSDELGFIIQEE